MAEEGEAGPSDCVRSVENVRTPLHRISASRHLSLCLSFSVPPSASLLLSFCFASFTFALHIASLFLL